MLFELHAHSELIQTKADSDPIMPPSEDKDAALAKQMFFIGCLGLPWLWFVNCLYFADKYFSNGASSGLVKWYTRSMTGAAVCAVGLAIWVIVFQSSWRNWSWAPNWMVSVPSEDTSGW